MTDPVEPAAERTPSPTDAKPSRRLLSGLTTVRWSRLSLGTFLALAATVAYTVTLGLLALAKYATFHATFEDLGIENQALWLLSHGGIPAYYDSGFAQIYPLQVQKPIMFLVLPLYGVYPHPETLLVIASVALGGAAIPLYLTAVRWLRRESYALAVTIAYLAYFPVASANLFDFHYEDLFPLAFFTMTWCYASGRIRAMYVAALVTAAVNPLTLITTIAFLVFTALPEPREPFGPQWIRAAWASFFRDYRKPLLTAFLLGTLVLYWSTGVLYTAGFGAHGAPSPPGDIFLSFANQKLLLVVLLAGSLAFLPLYSLRGLVTVVPYLGFVAYSTNSANFIAFGLMYPLLGTGPLFLALLDGLRGADPGPTPSGPEAPGGAATPATRLLGGSARWRLGRRTSERGAMVRSLLVTTTLFGLVFFPASPVNAYVSGGYWSGNHDFANITRHTSATDFLTQVIGLVPANASVLTQNNIPQLSGREHVQIASAYLPSVPYDAIVMDANVNYFSTPGQILPFVDAAFENGTFGVVAEGQGALYLQRGYAGPPQLFEPLNESLSPLSLTPFLAHVNGSALTGSGPGYSLWYGPFLDLYPGHYSCAFTLASNTSDPALGSAVTIDVTSDDGAHELARQTVFPGNFTAPNAPRSFVLDFNVTDVALSVEFRGMFPTGVATISLLGIAVVQSSYAP